MYVVFGNEILDSKDIIELINNESDFVVKTDLTKSTKREDIVALKLYIDLANINLDYKFNPYDEEIFQLYLDTVQLNLESFMKSNLDFYKRFIIEAYKWDEVENAIYLIMVISDISITQLKLTDIMRRLLKQND